MAEPHLTESQEMEIESHAPYLKVWAALAVFTAIEYFWARIFKDSETILILGLLFWAVLKAGLVGWYFMHLKFEGKWVYGFLVPAGFLASVVVFALVPDIAAKAAEENPAEEDISAVAPLNPGPARA
ncbi:MAG: cytochrome C oxidase subunit IV family protein [Isosphaeraceae bacterium]